MAKTDVQVRVDVAGMKDVGELLAKARREGLVLALDVISHNEVMPCPLLEEDEVLMIQARALLTLYRRHLAVNTAETTSAVLARYGIDPDEVPDGDADERNEDDEL